MDSNGEALKAAAFGTPEMTGLGATARYLLMGGLHIALDSTLKRGYLNLGRINPWGASAFLQICFIHSLLESFTTVYSAQQISLVARGVDLFYHV